MPKSSLLSLKLLLLIYLSLFSSSTFAKDNITLKLTQSAEQVWQRQQVLITLTVISNDPFSRLEAEPFKQNGFSITPFALQRVENKQQTTLTLKWAVFPFIAGKHLLKLPRLRYRPNRGRIQTLALEKLALNVRRLPLYIPPTMPVGKIKLASQWDESWLVSTHKLLAWQVSVVGEGVAEQFMPPLSRQLKSNEAVAVLPIKSNTTQLEIATGLNQKRSYNIPIKALKSGLLKLPEISVQYFEPNSGKLQKAQLKPPLIIALNTWLLGFLLFLLFTLVSLLVFIIIKKSKQIYHKRQQLKAALQQLSQATSYDQIRNALNEYTTAKGWGDNLTLEALAKQKTAKLDHNSQLGMVINKLQALRFSQQGAESEITAIKNELLRYLK